MMGLLYTLHPDGLPPGVSSIEADVRNFRRKWSNANLFQL